jgi:hypothetical protein
LVEENIIKSDNNISTTTTGKPFCDDGAYDGNAIFRYLVDNGILPCIKVRNNTQVRQKKGTF